VESNIADPVFRLRNALAPVLLAASATAQFLHVEEPARRADPSDARALAALRRTRGVWPVANGRVFAHVGLGDPANRMFMITGPHYQTTANHAPLGTFGEQWFEVLDGSGRALLPTRNEWRGLPLRAATRTVETFVDGTVLTVEDTAVENETSIVRDVRIERPPGSAARALIARFSDGPHGAARVSGAGLVKTCPRGASTDRLLAHARPLRGIEKAGVRTLDGELRFELDASARRCELGLYFDMHRVADAADADTADWERVAAARPPSVLASQAELAWRERLTGALRVEPSSWFAETAIAIQIATLAQRSLPGGAFGPMVSFKGVWLRDSNGPLRTLLWMGKFDEARQHLRYYHAASALHRATRREFPLDLPVASAPELTDDEWAATATDGVEVPSFVVLQHLWYYDWTGDGELIRAHWPWLRRNALGQTIAAGPHGPLQPFNGDETYLHGAFYALFPQRDVWPNQFPRASAWSLDSMLTYVAAQRAMQDLCEVAGHPEQRDAHARLERDMRESIDAHFWLEDRGFWAPALSPTSHAPHDCPYAPINLAPLWLGTHAPDDSKARRNLDAVIALLAVDGLPGAAVRSKRPLLRSTPAVKHFIGSLPGYWLANLTAVDHPLARIAFDELRDSASVSGEWAEVHGEDGRPEHSYGDGTYPNRLRPWESGLVLDAALSFLTGARPRAGRALELHPRLPRSTTVTWVGPIHVGESRVTLEYERDPDPHATVRIEGAPLVVNGELREPDTSFRLPLATPRHVTIPAERAFACQLARPRAEQRTLVVTTARREFGPDEYALDAGLPFAPDDLAALIFDPAAEGASAFDRVVIEPSALAADRETMKPARFWDAAPLRTALERFAAAGGELVRGTALTRWHIAGPFPNPDSRGLDVEVRPLTEPFDPNASFATKSSTARWREVEATDGRLDLHVPGAPTDWICCFARTVIHRDVPGSATLLLGTDDGCKVWLNGELVLTSIAHRHLSPGELRVPLALAAGDNVLVVGVEERTGAFGLEASLLAGGR
jgi:hypothetical protein